MSDTPLLFIDPDDLPADYRPWIDPERLLPGGVSFHPLHVKSLPAVIPSLVAGAFFFLMALAAPIAAGRQWWMEGFSSRTLYLSFGALFLAGFLSIFLYGLVSGAISELRLRRAARHGRLRHGIFISRTAVLIRYPHQMHLLPRSSFPRAELKERTRGQNTRLMLVFPFVLEGDAYEPLQIQARTRTPAETIVQTINQQM